MKIIPLYQPGTAEPSHIQAKKNRHVLFFFFIVLFFIGTGQEIPDNIMLTVIKNCCPVKNSSRMTPQMAH
jgi:hypothetical protein